MYTNINSICIFASAPLRNVPDYMIHEQFDGEESDPQYKAKKGPYDFDQKSIWQREHEENEEEEEDKKVLYHHKIFS